MKKVFTGILIAILAIGLAGCSPAQLAADSVKQTIDKYKAGEFDQSDFDAITQSLEESGLPQKENQNVVDIFKNMLAQVSYTINSSKADKNNPNLFIVNADVKSVDGNALFTSGASIDALINATFEAARSGQMDQTALTNAGMEAWIKQILTASKTVTATKSTNVDFKVAYDTSAKKFTAVDDGTAWESLLGIDGDTFSTLLLQKIQQKKELMATDSIKLIFEHYKAGVFTDSEIAAFKEAYDAWGVSGEGAQNLVDATTTMLSKISYEIKSSRVDENDPNLIIVNADIKTVDGTAIFTSDAAIDALANTIYDLVKSGRRDEAAMTTAGMDAWTQEVLAGSKAATAEKTANIDFKMTYDSTTNTFTDSNDEATSLSLIGLDLNDQGSILRQKLNDRLNEKLAEIQNAA